MYSSPTKKLSQEKTQLKLNPKAVFFDMDGVLYDSMKYHAKSWVRTMHEVGLPFDEHACYMNEGRTGHSTINNEALKVWGREATEEEKERIYQLKINYFNSFGVIEPMPFAGELLKKIKLEGRQIFVVTGSGQPTLLDSLERDFPQIFARERMVTAYDVIKGKPDPEPYLMALKKSDVQANEVVVIENAPLGVQSAHSAGLFCIGVNTGPLDPSVLYDAGANIVLDSIEELYNRWEEIM